MEDVESIKKKYSNLLNDITFDKLELGLKKPNIFEILQISNTEIRHSNFISWLLDANGSHGLGDTFSKRFLREIFSDDKAKKVTQLDVEGLDFSNIEIRREWRNIDLLVILDDIVICIENKVLSKEHSNQLSKYKRIIEEQFPRKNYRQIFVYLTPYGDESNSETDTYSFVSYDAIIDILTRIIKIYGDSLNQSVKLYISDYLTILKRNLMGNDNLSELAKTIYQNHKEIFDFVFDRKPDMAEEFRKYFENKISSLGWVEGSRNKGYVRFVPKSIEHLIPKNSKANGWPKREVFMFEIDYFWNKKNVQFRTVISPSEEDYVNVFKDIVVGVKGSSKPSGKKWLVHFTEKAPFDLEKLQDVREEEIIKIVDQFFEKITPIVESVSKEILKHEEKLKLLVNPFNPEKFISEEN
jgi:hypothetical protein